MGLRLREGLSAGADGRIRCSWTSDKLDYQKYHDEEWGMPISDDNRLFEKICLEGFQSGLSWLTILRKRENFRNAFANFDYEKIAEFSNHDVERLISNKGIVRHRAKIQSTISNARRAIVLAKEFGTLAAYFWQYEPEPGSRPKRLDFLTVRALSNTAESYNLSIDLKKRGWSLIGPTTAYAFMQAMGLVNDHIEGCEFRDQVEESRRNFIRPS